MMLLCINTTTPQFSLALMREEGNLASEYIFSDAKAGSSALVPSLDFVLKHAGIDMKDIRCIAVAVGPGSFTGLKVGLSLAKGLCFSMKLPVIGVSSLEALAIQLPHTELLITSIIDSRKDEFFLARFSWHGNGLHRETQDECLRIEDFPEKLRTKSIFIGNNYDTQAPLLKKNMGKDVLLAPPHMWNIRASNIGMLAMEKWKNRKFDNPLLVEPIYMRPPEIRPNPYWKGRKGEKTRCIQ